MTRRKIISLSILVCFAVLVVTGILEFFMAHTPVISALHTLFGLVFIVGAALHFTNNGKAIKMYLKKGKTPLLIVSIFAGFFVLIYIGFPPFTGLMDFGSKLRAGQEQEVNFNTYEVHTINSENPVQLTVDLVRGKHYWHPQMSIWTEDTEGNYLETIFISKATAQGLFFGGRSKANFKTFDEKAANTTGNYRRVDALPVWSHQRNVKYDDGLFVPPADRPLPDGITGATLSENFLLHTSAQQKNRFVLKIELNVAFDDNEFYSEYDFPDDETFHSGTGQLGQPSIIFETTVDLNDGKQYYLMDLVGHGHHSAQNGDINTDLSTLTTALEIVERIVIGVDFSAPSL